MSFHDDIYDQILHRSPEEQIAIHGTQQAMNFRASVQQSQQSASPLGMAGLGLGDLLGSLGAGQLGGIAGSRSYESIVAGSEKNKNAAMIGKVTPKPGYIIVAMKRNYHTRTVIGSVQKKVMSDYTRWERFLIWLNTPWGKS